QAALPDANREGPSGPRPPVRALDYETDARNRMAGRDALRGGPAGDYRLVPRQCGLDCAREIRRVSELLPTELREPGRVTCSPRLSEMASSSGAWKNVTRPKCSPP